MLSEHPLYERSESKNARALQMYSTPRFRFRWPCLQSRGITERKFCRAIIYIMGERRERTENLSSDFPMKIHIFAAGEIFLAGRFDQGTGLLLSALDKFRSLWSVSPKRITRWLFVLHRCSNFSGYFYPLFNI